MFAQMFTINHVMTIISIKKMLNATSVDKKNKNYIVNDLTKNYIPFWSI